jgi:predicted nucleic acid-binding protein
MNREGRLKFVVDASVVLKWFSQGREGHPDKAHQLREDFRCRKIDLFSPELLVHEVTNVLRFKKSLADVLVLKAIGSVYAMDLLVPVNQKIMENALKLAREHSITVYDSTYLSFARYCGCYLITADKKFSQKMKGVSGILYIEEYDLKP